jgi:hypothetical protein
MILGRNKKLLKKAVTVLLTALLLLVIFSAILQSSGRLLHSKTNSLGTNNDLPVNPVAEPDDVKATNPSGEQTQNAPENPINNAKPENNLTMSQPSADGDQSSPKTGETSQDVNSSTNTLPDGRIYLGPEAPYAYIPTCTQKGALIPIAPPDLGN